MESKARTKPIREPSEALRPRRRRPHGLRAPVAAVAAAVPLRLGRLGMGRAEVEGLEAEASGLEVKGGVFGLVTEMYHRDIRFVCRQKVPSFE